MMVNTVATAIMDCVNRLVRPPPSLVSLREGQVHCANCAQRRHCLPAELEGDQIRQFDELVGRGLRIRRRDALFFAGSEFHTLYAIRCGSFKTTILDEDGREQVAGFHMPGEIIGLDGIATSSHTSDAVALEDSEVCALPFDQLEALAKGSTALQRAMRNALAREVGRSHGLLLLLGSMRAEERLASFLLDLSRRYKQRGYSANEFVLRMSRAEIGSHLSLKIETVSRFFSRFHLDGLIHVQGRDVKLLNAVALRQIAGQTA
jgi:CRP/FNR family transcriptional regulator